MLSADESPKMKLLDPRELERLIKDALPKIQGAPDAMQTIPYTNAERAFISALITITTKHLSKNVSACFDRLADRIAELESEPRPPNGHSGGKR